MFLLTPVTIHSGFDRSKLNSLLKSYEKTGPIGDGGFHDMDAALPEPVYRLKWVDDSNFELKQFRYMPENNGRYGKGISVKVEIRDGPSFPALIAKVSISSLWQPLVIFSSALLGFVLIPVLSVFFTNVSELNICRVGLVLLCTIALFSSANLMRKMTCDAERFLRHLVARDDIDKPG